jgi:hypothetical protein
MPSSLQDCAFGMRSEWFWEAGEIDRPVSARQEWILCFACFGAHITQPARSDAPDALTKRLNFEVVLWGIADDRTTSGLMWLSVSRFLKKVFIFRAPIQVRRNPPRAPWEPRERFVVPGRFSPDQMGNWGCPNCQFCLHRELREIRGLAFRFCA